jgi:hypothetical protein
MLQSSFAMFIKIIGEHTNRGRVLAYPIFRSFLNLFGGLGHPRGQCRRHKIAALLVAIGAVSCAPISACTASIATTESLIHWRFALANRSSIIITLPRTIARGDAVTAMAYWTGPRDAAEPNLNKVIAKGGIFINGKQHALDKPLTIASSDLARKLTLTLVEKDGVACQPSQPGEVKMIDRERPAGPPVFAYRAPNRLLVGAPFAIYGAFSDATVHVDIEGRTLQLLARTRDTYVARLPETIAPGHATLAIAGDSFEARLPVSVLDFEVEHDYHGPTYIGRDRTLTFTNPDQEEFIVSLRFAGDATSKQSVTAALASDRLKHADPRFGPKRSEMTLISDAVVYLSFDQFLTGPTLEDLTFDVGRQWESENQYEISSKARSLIWDGVEGNAALLEQLTTPYRKRHHREYLTEMLLREYLYDLRDLRRSHEARLATPLPGFVLASFQGQASQSPRKDRAQGIDPREVNHFDFGNFLKEIAAQLLNEVGFLEVESEPQGWGIWIGGNGRGSTRTQRVLSAGHYRVEVGPSYSHIRCAKDIMIHEDATEKVACPESQ